MNKDDDDDDDDDDDNDDDDDHHHQPPPSTTTTTIIITMQNCLYGSVEHGKWLPREFCRVCVNEYFSYYTWLYVICWLILW